jgi:HEAT repeat protein
VDFFKKRGLRAQLKSGDTKQRVEAASGLAELGDSSDLPILVKYLESSDDFANINCVMGLVYLARNRSQEALSLLVRATHSKNKETAYAAIVGLSWG